MQPRLGVREPAMIDDRVDLPAPFSPSSATTSPRPISRLMLSSTPIPLNDIPNWSARKNGACVLAIFMLGVLFMGGGR
ncbi:hypothetical protein D3C79_841000 [compost metagenome]